MSSTNTDHNTVEYVVTGMSCGHCENAIRDEVGRVPGVTGIEVSAKSGHLAVTVAQAIENPAAFDAAVFAAVDEAGYTAVRA